MIEQTDTFAPRLIRRKKAADYLGLSIATFDRLVKAGVLPPPRKLLGFKAWDRVTLYRFVDGLPTDAAVVERLY